MRVLPALMSFVVVGGIMYLLMRRNRDRSANAPLRDEIQAQVCLSTSLDHVSILGRGGFEGTRGQWIRFKGPKRLVVGTEASMISLPGLPASLHSPDAHHPSRSARHRLGLLNATG